MYILLLIAYDSLLIMSLLNTLLHCSIIAIIIITVYTVRGRQLKYLSIFSDRCFAFILHCTNCWFPRNSPSALSCPSNKEMRLLRLVMEI